MGPEALVIMISLLATAVIFLVILYPQWRGVTEGSAESSAECSFELLLRNIIKQASFGFADAPVNCPVKKVIVTSELVEKQKKLAQQVTKSYSENDVDIFLKTGYPDDEYGQTKWILSKIVADELISCYNKGWKGEIDLRPPDQRDWFQYIITAGPLGQQTTGLGGPENVICLLCARITYPSQYFGLDIDSRDFKSWLENNLAEKQSYYDYLTQQKNDMKDLPSNTILDAIDRSKITPKEGTAVLLITNDRGNAFVHATDYSKIGIGKTLDIYPPIRGYNKAMRCALVLGDM
jgi:hypothetical protein